MLQKPFLIALCLTAHCVFLLFFLFTSLPQRLEPVTNWQICCANCGPQVFLRLDDEKEDAESGQPLDIQ
jgi:hypothetical protein